jgi:hypothetical protein
LPYFLLGVQPIHPSTHRAARHKHQLAFHR